VTYNDLESTFGKEIADGVQALTKNKKLPKEARLKDSLNRIIQQPKEIWMVKMADRITNLQQPPTHWSKEKIKNYYEEAVLIHSTLKNENVILATRLENKIADYRKYFLDI